MFDFLYGDDVLCVAPLCIFPGILVVWFVTVVWAKVGPWIEGLGE